MELDVHVVSHTHWDREWYAPAERFRQRLVALVDELLDTHEPGDSFLLDGQAIVLEDYLDVRPERADALTAALRNGWLEAGPWYVLGDELIPGGEAMIRNLLTGRRLLRRLGATAPPVLYCPDSFGHPANLPALAAGFGFPLIVLWRGYGGVSAPDGDTARWAAPGGDEVLLHHLARDGYELGSNLPTSAAHAAARWRRMRDELAPRSASGVLLVPNGADHHAPQLGLHDALDALENAGARDNVHRSSLSAFANALVERAATLTLPRVTGELRDSYGYTWTLQGTFATRAHEKRLNARAERLLVREAEPWAALAARRGLHTQPLMNAAWRTLLAAHPHDTLCGCSIDEVAQAMELRIRSAANQARGVIHDSVEHLIGHDAPMAREARDRWTPIVIVRNPAPRARSGVAILEIESFVADVAVGPGSSAIGVEAPAIRATVPRISSLGALQVLSTLTKHVRTESARHYPDNDLVSVFRVAAWVSDAAPYGLESHPVDGERGAGGVRPARAVAGARSIDNGLVQLEVTGTGSISLHSARDSRHIASLFDFVDEADVGDLYTAAPRARPFVITFRGARRVHRGPLRAQLALKYDISDGGSGVRAKIADVVVQLILHADSPIVRLAVAGTNRQPNHRLRMLFHSDVAGSDSWADAALGVVRREPIVVSSRAAAVELPPPTAPLHRYVSRFTRERGVTLISDGLAEYEALASGSIAVTLVRAVGELSRNDLPERPGHAGWPSPTPLAQCVGPFEAEFGVLLHGARHPAVIDEIERAADDLLNPITGTTLRSALGVPGPVRGIELAGTGLAFSAAKTSEDGEWLVLRCVNVSDETVAGAWRVPFDVREAGVARLDETLIGDIPSIGGTIDFVAEPRAIVTLLAR